MKKSQNVNVNAYRGKYSFKKALRIIPENLIEYSGSVNNAPISDVAKQHYTMNGYTHLILVNKNVQ